MDKDIREYIHYYLHCKVEWDGDVWEITSVSRGAVSMCCVSSSRARYFHGISLPEGAKPILRKLESMSTKESDELNNVMWDGFPDAWEPLEETLKMFLHPWDGEYRPAFPVYVKALNWLRLKGFDCDELIENGLAIDKETLTP